MPTPANAAASSVPHFTATLSDLAAQVRGELLQGRGSQSVHGLFTDTRAPIENGVFLALKGESFDGNRFARAAVDAGAAAVISDDPALTLPPHAGLIRVACTREAYLGLAAFHRRRLDAPIWFGITGSVGKSTTKEFLSHLLEQGAQWPVHKARGSFNNEIGLSHTILNAQPEHRAVVLEIGTNHPGEIRQLTKVASPHIAVLTCAAESHLEAFHTVDNVAKEKGDIFAFQERGDVAVINADSPYCEQWRAIAKGRVITFGTANHAELSARQIAIGSDGCASFLLRWQDDLVAVRLAVAGAHQISNALAAAAAALAAGVPLRAIAVALGTFQGVARRFNLRTVNGVTLIDDAYNANPASFRAALQTLSSMNSTGSHRLFVVAGDMLELGSAAERQHEQLGRDLARTGLAGLVTVGELALRAGSSAVDSGLPRTCWNHCGTPEDAALALKPALRPGDVVLVKGSHSTHLDRCCALLSA